MIIEERGESFDWLLRNLEIYLEISIMAKNLINLSISKLFLFKKTCWK